MRRNSTPSNTYGVTGSSIRYPTCVPRICGNSAKARAELCTDSGADRASLQPSGSSLLCRSTELYYANISSRLANVLVVALALIWRWRAGPLFILILPVRMLAHLDPVAGAQVFPRQ